MSLLWRTAMVRTATWEPRDSEEHIHPGDMEGDKSRYELNGKHIDELASSIKQHGYDPARHGQLGINVTDNGENLYTHSRGTEAHPDHPNDHHEHLLHALRDAGHGEVPVHIHDQSSNESGTAPTYYHGTTEEDLEQVHPNHGSRGTFGNNGGIHEPGYAYATSRSSAEHYADRAAEMRDGARPHVYQVEPKGPVEKDPTYDVHGNHRGNFTDDVRSKHGFTVMGEEDLGHDDPDEYEDEDDWNEHHGSDWD
jgi:hypothetical protein